MLGFGVQVSEFGTRAHSLRAGPGAVSAADKHSEHSNTDIEPRDLAPVLIPSQQPAVDSPSRDRLFSIYYGGVIGGGLGDVCLRFFGFWILVSVGAVAASSNGSGHRVHGYTLC